MADTYSTLLIERHADGYALVTLNRPEALNALNSQLLSELSAALDQAEADDSDVELFSAHDVNRFLMMDVPARTRRGVISVFGGRP